VVLQAEARIVFTTAIEGAAYARHGTTAATRLTVIDKVPANDPREFPASPGSAPNAATLLNWVLGSVPPRLPVSTSVVPLPDLRVPAIRIARAAATRAIPAPSLVALEVEPLAYETVDWRPAETGRLTEALYEA
jgi:hypothetical protein